MRTGRRQASKTRSGESIETVGSQSHAEGLYSKLTNWAVLERKQKEVADKRKETVAVLEVTAELALVPTQSF